MPTTLEILFLTTSVCFFQDKPSSLIKPRKFNDFTRFVDMYMQSMFEFHISHENETFFCKLIQKSVLQLRNSAYYNI